MPSRSLITREWEIHAALRAAREGKTWQARRPVLTRHLLPGWLLDERLEEREPDLLKRCPLGSPGDVIALRETWGWVPGVGKFYRADGEPPEMKHRRWLGPRTMGDEIVRLRLLVAEVRCERVQDMTDSDRREMGLRCDDESSVMEYGERWATVLNNLRALHRVIEKQQLDTTANAYQWIARGRVEVKR